MNPAFRFPPTYRARFHAAFTLTELLVVITIIAILMAVIFPAVGSALHKTQQSTSISNLHQWYSGFSASVGDNDGDMPTPGGGLPDAGDTQAWFNRMPAALNVPTYAQFIGRSDRPAYGVKSIWVNPIVPRGDTVNTFTFFYGYNDKLVDNASAAGSSQPLKLARLDNIKLTILMGEKADASPSLNVSNARAYFTSTDSRNDQNGMADFLFCDGHVDSVKRSVFAGAAASDSNSFVNREATVSWLPFAQQ